MKQGYNAVAEIALDDDESVFGTAAHSKACFEGFAKVAKVVISADKARDDGDGLAATPAAFHPNPQLLSRRGQGLGLDSIMPGYMKLLIFSLFNTVFNSESSR